MKNNRICWMIILLIFTVSCNLINKSTENSKISQEDSNGKIGGRFWKFVSGKAILRSYDTSTLDIRLFESQFDPNHFDPDEDKILFYVPNSIGYYQLGNEAQTVTLYDNSEKLHNIAIEGYIDIKSISTTEVTGTVDAKVDQDNFVNCEFKILLKKI